MNTRTTTLRPGGGTTPPGGKSMQYLLSADQPENLQARELLPDQPGFIVAIDGLLT